MAVLALKRNRIQSGPTTSRLRQTRERRLSFRLDRGHVENSVETPEELVQKNIGLVRKLCSPFAKGIPVEDTEQYSDGILGLIKASQSYDPKISEFSTWAWEFIKNEIKVGHRNRNVAKRSIPKIRFGEDFDVEDHNAIRPDMGPIVDEKEMLKILFSPCEDDTDSDILDKQILWDHFYNGISWQDIGDKLEVSKCRAMQRGQKAIARLREQFADILK